MVRLARQWATNRVAWVAATTSLVAVVAGIVGHNVPLVLTALFSVPVLVHGTMLSVAALAEARGK